VSEQSPSADLAIRFATDGDAETLLATAQAAFAELRDKIDPPPGIVFETIADVHAALRDHGAIIAERDGIAVGSARFEEKPGYLYIGRLAVVPDARRTGVGRAMMAFLEAHAATLGLPQTQVEVREALPGNIAMFTALGYEVIARQPHPRVPTAMTVTMAKQVMPG
jgi:ribosomal protein S18 acetylase RimI-like enzyme